MPAMPLGHDPAHLFGRQVLGRSRHGLAHRLEGLAVGCHISKPSGRIGRLGLLLAQDQIDGLTVANDCKVLYVIYVIYIYIQYTRDRSRSPVTTMGWGGVGMGWDDDVPCTCTHL